MSENRKLTDAEKIQIARDADKAILKRKIEIDRPRSLTLPEMVAYVKNEYPDKVDEFKEIVLAVDGEGKVKNQTPKVRSYLYNNIVPGKGDTKKKSYREALFED